MENITKALLIASGVLISIMVLGLIIMLWDQISAYYTAQHEATMVQQNIEFNNKFENYNRKSIRGTDIISLMNRVIDYNLNEAYLDGTGAEPIAVTIEIGEENLKQFKYQEGDYTNWNTNEFLLPRITNKIGEVVSAQNDKKLIAITSTVQTLSEYMGMNITDSQFQLLSANISNILLNAQDESSNSVYSQSKREKRAEVLKKIGIDIEFDDNFKPKSQTQMEKIKSITSRYYQYMQFKRAYFDCTEMRHDTGTGRIAEMYFKVQTKDFGGNTVVVFN